MIHGQQLESINGSTTFFCYTHILSAFSLECVHKRATHCLIGVLTTLNFIGACSTKVYLIFVDPKSKISEKSDQN